MLQYEGQVSVLNFKNSPCHRCLYREYPKETDLSTDKLGVLNSLCEMTSSVMVSEFLKIVTHSTNVNYNHLILIDALEPSIKKIKIFKNPHCQLCKGANQE